jgi:hypothetical protein
MTATTELHTPPSLREFLEAGCDPRPLAGPLDGFIDDLITAELADTDVSHLAASKRICANEVLEDCWYDEADRMHPDKTPRESVHVGVSPEGFGWDSCQQYVTCMNWEADILEDAEVRRLLIPHLSADEQADYERRLYECRHAHPIVLESASEHGRCSACGEDFQPGQMAAVPEEANDVAYCFACVTIVYEAMKAAQG